MRWFNALHLAVLEGDAYCTAKLIEKFPKKINEVIKTSYKTTTISTASAAKGGFFDPMQYKGFSPLDLATAKQDETLISLLKQNGAKSMKEKNTEAESRCTML